MNQRRRHVDTDQRHKSPTRQAVNRKHRARRNRRQSCNNRHRKDAKKVRRSLERRRAVTEPTGKRRKDEQRIEADVTERSHNIERSRSDMLRARLLKPATKAHQRQREDPETERQMHGQPWRSDHRGPAEKKKADQQLRRHSEGCKPMDQAYALTPAGIPLDGRSVWRSSLQRDQTVAVLRIIWFLRVPQFVIATIRP